MTDLKIVPKLMKPVLITITGPSCAGKTTLEQYLISRGAARVISNTTRSPRKGEVDGVDYRFRDRNWFDRHQALGKLVESVEFNGNYYGNTEEDITDAIVRGRGFAVWVIEPHGHKQVKKWHENSPAGRQVRHYSVFVDGSIASIAERFLDRFDKDITGSLKSYASRLAVMMGQERAWALEANFDLAVGGHLYDCYLERFDKENEAIVVDWLVDVAYRPTCTTPHPLTANAAEFGAVFPTKIEEAA